MLMVCSVMFLSVSSMYVGSDDGEEESVLLSLSLLSFMSVCPHFLYDQEQTLVNTMAATSDADVGEEEILSYKPLGENSAVSANPHIPSVTASAVLGESESVRKS